MIHAKMYIDPHFVISEVEPEMFSSFLEHLGRVVYDGTYCPGHSSANEDGFRQDIMEFIRLLQIPLMRYPGGNFVSGYHWEDGVGPGAFLLVQRRPPSGIPKQNFRRDSA